MENKPGFFKSNKKELIGTGIGTGVGATIGALAARSKAKRQAEEMGLSNHERRAYVRKKTLGGTAIGAGVGAAAGFGASKIPFNKLGKSSGHKGNVQVPIEYANSPEAKILNQSFEDWSENNKGKTLEDFQRAQNGARKSLERKLNKDLLKNDANPNHGDTLTHEERVLIKDRVKQNNARKKGTKANIAANEEEQAKLRDLIQKGGDPNTQSKYISRLNTLEKRHNALVEGYKNLSNTEYLYNLKNKQMSTIIFDEETRSFSVIEDHIYTNSEVKAHLNKYKAYYGMGAGAAVGAGTGAVIARKKAKKEADRRGLTGAARRRFINQKTGVGAGVGLGAGAVVGTGAVVGNEYRKAYRDANLEAKYGMTHDEWKKLNSAEKSMLRNIHKDKIVDAKLDKAEKIKEAKLIRDGMLKAAGNDPKAKLAAKRAHRDAVNHINDEYIKQTTATGKSAKSIRQSKTEGIWTRLLRPNA